MDKWASRIAKLLVRYLLIAAACFLIDAPIAVAQECAYDSEPWLCNSPQLTGDWFGLRSSAAEQGYTFLADNTSFFFGNTRGGVNQDFVFGGHGDYLMYLDGGKLGLQEGLSLKLRAEQRFGDTIVDDVGCFISPTLAADLPVFNSNQLYLTNVLLTQQLSETVGVFAGKMDTLDGDLNAFAHGRGKTQFSNMGFVFNPIVAATVPYSTLGAGFFVLRDGLPMFMFAILNSQDTTNTSGFRELFNDGMLLSTSLRIPTNFLGRPGHHLFGGTWNSKTYLSIGDAYVEYPNIVIPSTRGSWCLYWNGDQYLVVDPHDPTRGWGVFSRAGIADPNTSPLSWYLSFGVGGSSPIASRPADTFGVGWYYAGTSSQIGPLFVAQFGPISNGEAVELYYNWQLTPAIRVTPDLQVIVPALTDNKPALLIGVRTQLIF